MSVLLVGIDLSGPSNTADTVLTLFRADLDAGDAGDAGDAERRNEASRPPERDIRLRAAGVHHGVGDLDILRLCDVAAATAVRKIVVGLDAPLSYNPGGGDRPADAALRRRLAAAGLKPATVMTPTMTRMAYLTLRGVVVARLLSSWAAELPGTELVIYEVHPGGVMALCGAAPEDVRALKVDAAARLRLCDWFQTEGTLDIGAGGAGLAAREGAGRAAADKAATPESSVPSDHAIAATAAALGAWNAACGRPAWLYPAEPPLHPFAVCC